MEEKTNIYVVGQIDKNIYGCISNNILTDEVIITENQIQPALKNKKLFAVKQL